MAQSNPKPQAVGSIWNINSWHWENKNYTEVAKSLITNKLTNYVWEKDGVSVILLKVDKIKGDAQINVRKGKQIITYEFEMEVEWNAENEIDSADGTFKIAELSESDLDDIQIQSIHVKESTQISEKVKELIRKHLKKELQEKIFKSLNEDLSKYESDPTKIEADKKAREDAALATKKAREEKGAEKDKIFEEQRLKEQKMKEEMSKLK